MTDWTPDDRAAARAYLQRCEVRLSTLHRVATALLSGAGLMVLLPAMVRDQVTEVVRTLLTATGTWPHIALAIASIVVVTLPFVVLFVLLGDLTRFYFHAQHLSHGDHTAFAPRFTLTGLRIPSDELSPAAAAQVEAMRQDPATIELLVPPNSSSRAAIDDKLAAYRGMGMPLAPGDRARADGLFELVASRPRPLAEEVAKVEHGMARHLLRLQVIVIRYVKALLVFLTTALAVFAALGVVHSDPELGATAELVLAAVFAWWAPVVVYVVGAPVRWVESLLRAEGSTVSSIAADSEFSTIERITIGAALISWVLCAAGVTGAVAAGDLSGRATVLGVGSTIAALMALVSATRRSVTVGPNRR